MRKPKEYEIEKMVLDPSSLSAVARQRIRFWLEKDPQLKAYFSWIKEFYKNLGQFENSRKRDDSIPLTVELNILPERPRKREQFILAAQSVSIRENACKIVKSFASEENQTVLRILHDDSTDIYTIYIISSYLDEVDICLIEDDEGKLYITKPDNSIELPSHQLAASRIDEWQKLRIHIPMCRIYFYRGLLKTTRFRFCD